MPTDLPVAAEQGEPIADAEPAVKEEEPATEAVAEPAAEDAAAEPEEAEAGQKRGRDEAEADADEPEAKRAAPAEASVRACGAGTWAIFRLQGGSKVSCTPCVHANRWMLLLRQRPLASPQLNQQ